MIKVTIEGPQGCGKTTIAEMLCKMFEFCGLKCRITENGKQNSTNDEVVIRTKQEKQK